MSATANDETVRCEGCGSSGPLYEYHHGEYCSNLCEYRAKGAELIEAVESQSQFCDTCYGHVRDVEPIPESKIAGKGYDADGYQHKTPLSTIGVDDFSRDPYRRLEGTRWSCRCGAVDPDGGPIAELQNVHLADAVANLLRALAWLADREAIPHAPDQDAYYAALEDRWRDAAYACGVAVYGSEP